MATVTRPAPTARYLRRGTCLGKRRPDCTATWHGTESAYKNGCRCPHASEAYRIYQKRLREGRNTPRLVNATGTHRRIQALWALGHNSATIGAVINIGEHHVQRIVHYRDFVGYHTWHLIDRAYRELSMTPGTSGHTRNRARRAGYAPPLAWEGVDIDDPDAQPNLGDTHDRQDGYDPLTVALAIDGRLTYDQIAVHRPDLIETVRRLAQTLTDIEIAHHLRWPGADDGPAGKTRGQAAVCKLRSREGIPAPDKFEAVYAYHTTRGRDRAARAAARKAA